jgi:hypothetical protein
VSEIDAFGNIVIWIDDAARESMAGAASVASA